MNKKVTYLAEGVTGKQMQAAKIKASRANKDELRSLSFQCKQVKKHGQEFMKAAKLTEMDVQPANIIPYLTEREKGFDGFSYWTVQNCMIRFAKARHNNKVNA